MERTSDLDQNLINFKQKLGILSLPVCDRHAGHSSAVVSFLNPSPRHTLVVWVPLLWQARFFSGYGVSILQALGPSSRPDTVGTGARYISTAPPSPQNFTAILSPAARLRLHCLAVSDTKENLESMTGGVLHLRTPHFLWPHHLQPALELFITLTLYCEKKKRYIKLPIWIAP